MTPAKPIQGIVPSPHVLRNDGYYQLAKCALCDERLADRTAAQWHRPGDPRSLYRFAHDTCAREHATFVRALRG